VVIPKELHELLKSGVNVTRVRVRRDISKILDLTRASALLFAMQRRRDGQGQIVATEVDARKALDLASALKSELSPQLEGIAMKLWNRFGESEFTNAMGMSALGYSDPDSVGKKMAALEAADSVERADPATSASGKRGRRAIHWKLKAKHFRSNSGQPDKSLVAVRPGDIPSSPSAVPQGTSVTGTRLPEGEPPRSVARSEAAVKDTGGVTGNAPSSTTPTPQAGQPESNRDALRANVFVALAAGPKSYEQIQQLAGADQDDLLGILNSAEDAREICVRYWDDGRALCWLPSASTREINKAAVRVAISRHRSRTADALATLTEIEVAEVRSALDEGIIEGWAEPTLLDPGTTVWNPNNSTTSRGAAA
jgi:hypothetical protein